jgi:hypothetical protein
MSNDLGRDFESFFGKAQVVLKKMPVLLANEMEHIVSDNFRYQRQLGSLDGPWAPPEDPNRKGSAVLVVTGKLKRKTRTLKADWSGVAIINDAKYAAFHNDGFDGMEEVRQHYRIASRKVATKYNKNGKASKRGLKKIQGKGGEVKGFTRWMRMKRRRFMGDNQYAADRLERVAIQQLQTIY